MKFATLFSVQGLGQNHISKAEHQLDVHPTKQKNVPPGIYDLSLFDLGCNRNQELSAPQTSRFSAGNMQRQIQIIL